MKNRKLWSVLLVAALLACAVFAAVPAAAAETTDADAAVAQLGDTIVIP